MTTEIMLYTANEIVVDYEKRSHRRKMLAIGGKVAAVVVPVAAVIAAVKLTGNTPETT